MEELCKELQKLSEVAEHKIKSLKMHSKDTDTLVMKAVLKIEEEAMLQRSFEPLTLLPQSLTPYNPQERASMQINEEEMIRNRPLGQTAPRGQNQERPSDSCTLTTIPDDKDHANRSNNDFIAHSPIESTAAKELQIRRGLDVLPIDRPIDIDGNEDHPVHDALSELQTEMKDVVAGPLVPEIYSFARPMSTRKRPDIRGILPTGATIARSALANGRPRSSKTPHTSNTSRRRVSFQTQDDEFGAYASVENTSKAENLESKSSAEVVDTEELVTSAKLPSRSRRRLSAPTISTIPDTLGQTSATDPGVPVAPAGIFDTQVSLKSEPESIESIVKSSPISQVAYVAQPSSEVRLPQDYCATSNRVDTDTEKTLVGAECDEKGDGTQRANTSSASCMGETAVQPTMRPSASEKTHWRRFIELLKKHARPAVQPGHQRIEWQCVRSNRHCQVSNC
jgi:hypothetical protein